MSLSGKIMDCIPLFQWCSLLLVLPHIAANIGQQKHEWVELKMDTSNNLEASIFHVGIFVFVS